MDYFFWTYQVGKCKMSSRRHCRQLSNKKNAGSSTKKLAQIIFSRHLTYQRSIKFMQKVQSRQINVLEKKNLCCLKKTLLVFRLQAPSFFLICICKPLLFPNLISKEIVLAMSKLFSEQTTVAHFLALVNTMVTKVDHGN